MTKKGWFYVKKNLIINKFIFVWSDTKYFHLFNKHEILRTANGSNPKIKKINYRNPGNLEVKKQKSILNVLIVITVFIRGNNLFCKTCIIVRLKNIIVNKKKGNF